MVADDDEKNTLPEHIVELLAFLEDDKDCIDLHRVKGSEQVSKLLSPKVSPSFLPIGMHGSQSLICFWKYSDNLALDAMPIVWLDSEGSPNSIFASDLNAFLSLLPYGTGAIYDFILSWQYYFEAPDNYPNPLNKYDSSDMDLLIEQCRIDHPDYDQFVAWLHHNLKVTTAENPIKLVGEAIEKFPRLEDWLKDYQ